MTTTERVAAALERLERRQRLYPTGDGEIPEYVKGPDSVISDAITLAKDYPRLAAENATLMSTATLLTARQVAERIGRHKTTVLRVALTHGIGLSAGPGSQRYFTERDVLRLGKLCRDKAGNPNFVAGNHFGKPKKVRKSDQKK